LSILVISTFLLILFFQTPYSRANRMIGKPKIRAADSSSFARSIVSIEPATGEAGCRFHIILDGKPKDYNAFRLSNPPRLVLDLPDLLSSLSSRTLSFENPLVEGIRIGLHEEKVRVVFDLFPEAADRMHRVDLGENRLIVTFETGVLDPKSSESQSSGNHGTDRSTWRLETSDEPEDGGRGYYDLAVFAYEDGDYADAESLLRTAIRFNPVNPLYNHYLGKIYFKKAQYRKAERCFSRAWKQNPNLYGLKYDIALLHYKTSDYSKAAEIFTQIAEEDPSNVLALYYAGMSLYRQNLYKTAVSYLIKASEKSPSIKCNGYYYAGICHYKIGDIKSASEKFTYVKNRADSETMKNNALMWLDLIEKNRRVLKPYRVYLKLSYLYDDNVRLEPLDEDIYADEGDYLASAYFSGSYNIVNHNKGILGFGYSHYQTWFRELNEYDLMGNIPSIYGQYRFFPFTLGATYFYSRYLLDSEKFLIRNEIVPEATWQINKDLLAILSYSLTQEKNYENRERDADINEAWLSTYYTIANGKGYVFGGFGYDDNSASHPDYDYDRLKYKLGISIKLPWELNMDLNGRYYHRKHDNIDSYYGIKREDHRYYGFISLSRKLGYDWLSITGEYSYTKNDSTIDDYTYKRSVGGLSLIIRY